MSLLVLSPEFASHYGPLAVIAEAARRSGSRVVVATGPELRARVEADGFEWRPLQLGASSNSGIVDRDPGIARFIEATRGGPLATIRSQALDRETDLLWQPERVAADIDDLCESINPECVLVDHVSFGSTLGMYAAGRPFVTLVPGHPSQLPVGTERYGVPSDWPDRMRPDPGELTELEQVVDRVTIAFTRRWNSALASITGDQSPVADSFRVHGSRVLYNSVPEMNSPARSALLPNDHRFVGPLVREEQLPAEMQSWSESTGCQRQVYVALGTFLSHRSDVLAVIAEALRLVGARAAIAIGATSVDELGRIPENWLVARELPQVAMMRSADLVIHHGGNNSVQEALAAGVRQIVLPFSTDQFSNAADLERVGAGSVFAPNETTSEELAQSIEEALASWPVPVSAAVADDRIFDALFA